jgi:hypothetical protein
MPQAFGPNADVLLRLTVCSAGLLSIVAVLLGTRLARPDYLDRADRGPEQPVPFSHRHHVQEDGIDCRFCHVTATTAPSAGMPATQTCMACHSELFTETPVLEPVRASWQTGEPLVWNRVYALPDYARFDHGAHAAGGIGCEECHGRVDEMPLVVRTQALTMGWCLDCHQDPGPHQRPLDALTTMGFVRSDEDEVPVIDLTGLSDCSTCHR